MDKQSSTKRLKELNVYDLFSYRPEIKLIPRVLPEEENIEAASAGISAGLKWMLVFGRNHIYFIHTHPVNGQKTRKVPYDSITAFTAQKGFFFGKILLSMGEENIKIENCPRRTIPQVQRVLGEYRARPQSGDEA
jgi:hypothetical protein